MAGHKVHKDKTGLYVVSGRRKFRPTTSTLAVKDDAVYVGTSLPDTVQVSKYSWENNKHTTHYQETWTTTEVPPQNRERLKDGQVNITLGTNNKTVAVVGHDGFNYRRWRREPNGYSQIKTVGNNVLFPAQMMLTWEHWDELVAKVAQARTLVEIGPIATKLEDELKAHDDLEKYLQDKGLKPVEATDGE